MRIDGTRAPGINVRLEMRARSVSITVSTRVRDAAGAAGFGAERVMVGVELYGRLSSTVCRNCIAV